MFLQIGFAYKHTCVHLLIHLKTGLKSKCVMSQMPCSNIFGIVQEAQRYIVLLSTTYRICFSFAFNEGENVSKTL